MVDHYRGIEQKKNRDHCELQCSADILSEYNHYLNRIDPNEPNGSGATRSAASYAPYVALAETLSMGLLAQRLLLKTIAKISLKWNDEGCELDLNLHEAYDATYKTTDKLRVSLEHTLLDLETGRQASSPLCSRSYAPKDMGPIYELNGIPVETEFIPLEQVFECIAVICKRFLLGRIDLNSDMFSKALDYLASQRKFAFHFKRMAIIKFIENNFVPQDDTQKLKQLFASRREILVSHASENLKTYDVLSTSSLTIERMVNEIKYQVGYFQRHKYEILCNRKIEAEQKAVQAASAAQAAAATARSRTSPVVQGRRTNSQRSPLSPSNRSVEPKRTSMARQAQRIALSVANAKSPFQDGKKNDTNNQRDDDGDVSSWETILEDSGGEVPNISTQEIIENANALRIENESILENLRTPTCSSLEQALQSENGSMTSYESIYSPNSDPDALVSRSLVTSPCHVAAAGTDSDDLPESVKEELEIISEQVEQARKEFYKPNSFGTSEYPARNPIQDMPLDLAPENQGKAADTGVLDESSRPDSSPNDDASASNSNDSSTRNDMHTRVNPAGSFVGHFASEEACEQSQLTVEVQRTTDQSVHNNDNSSHGAPQN